MNLNILIITLGGEERGSVRLRIAQLEPLLRAEPGIQAVRVDSKCSRIRLALTILCFALKNLFRTEKLILIQRLVSPKWLVFFLLPLLKNIGFRIFYDIDDEVILPPQKVKTFNSFLSGVSAAYPNYPSELGLKSPVFFYPTPLDENIEENPNPDTQSRHFTFAWIGTYVTYRTQVKALLENISVDQSIKIITGKLSEENRAEIESMSPNLSVVEITDWLDANRIMRELQEATYGLHMSRHRERAGGMSYKVVHYIQAGLIPIEIGERDPALVNVCDEFNLETIKLAGSSELGGVSKEFSETSKNIVTRNTKNIEQMRINHFVKPLMGFWGVLR